MSDDFDPDRHQNDNDPARPPEKRKNDFDVNSRPSSSLLTRIVIPLLVAFIGAFAIVIASGNGETLVNITVIAS